MSTLDQMLLESGLAPDDALDVAELLSPLARDLEAPAPSAELAALFGEEAHPSPLAALGVPLRVRTSVASAVVLAVASVGATGLSAAANTLPSSLQHHVSEFSRHYLPFDLPEPTERSKPSAKAARALSDGVGATGAPGHGTAGLGADAAPAPRADGKGRAHAGPEYAAAHPGAAYDPDAHRFPNVAPSGSPQPSPQSTPSPTSGGSAKPDIPRGTGSPSPSATPPQGSTPIKAMGPYPVKGLTITKPAVPDIGAGNGWEVEGGSPTTPARPAPSGEPETPPSPGSGDGSESPSPKEPTPDRDYGPGAEQAQPYDGSGGTGGTEDSGAGKPAPRVELPVPDLLP